MRNAQTMDKSDDDDILHTTSDSTSTIITWGEWLGRVVVMLLVAWLLVLVAALAICAITTPPPAGGCGELEPWGQTRAPSHPSIAYPPDPFIDAFEWILRAVHRLMYWRHCEGPHSRVWTGAFEVAHGMQFVAHDLDTLIEREIVCWWRNGGDRDCRCVPGTTDECPWESPEKLAYTSAAYWPGVTCVQRAMDAHGPDITIGQMRQFIAHKAEERMGQVDPDKHLAQAADWQLRGMIRLGKRVREKRAQQPYDEAWGERN